MAVIERDDVLNRKCDTSANPTVVTGHTGRYDGCAYPMLGGATVIAIGGREKYVTPSMIRPGDALAACNSAGASSAGTAVVTPAMTMAAAVQIMARSEMTARRLAPTCAGSGS